MKRKTCLNCTNYEWGHCNVDWTLLDGPKMVNLIDTCTIYKPVQIEPDKSLADSTRLKKSRHVADYQWRAIRKTKEGYVVLNMINVGELGKELGKHCKTIDEVEDYIY